MNAGRCAFLFPGQGSQAVGMGCSCADAFPSAGAVFAEADAALGFPLSRLLREGPEEELQLTANQQPAVLTASIAVFRALAENGVEPDAVAGHSLGEYSALVAAGALDFGEAVRLVRRRGELMQEAVPPGAGAMAAVLGLEESAVREAAAAASGPGVVCTVANLNAPGQVVVAGHRAAVEQAIEEAKARGARRAVMLSVSAPFHSPLMAPARAAMAPLLAQVELRDPRVPVVCNVDAKALSDAEAVRDALLRQIDQPVRWVESIQLMAAELGVGHFVEVGPGKVLAGLVRRIAPDARIVSVADAEGIEQLVAA